MQSLIAPSASSTQPPDFLALGHVTKDLTPDGDSLGGTATYAALTATKFGITAAIVTNTSPDLDLSPLRNARVHSLPSTEPTTFRNVYEDDRRTQYIDATALAITYNDIPEEWRTAPMVVLGPVAGEVGDDLASRFPHSIVVATLQGWLRKWRPTEPVRLKRWEGTAVLPHVDAAVVSTDDMSDHTLINRWAQITPVLIVTSGARGARLHYEGAWHEIAAFPAHEVDPTGAGDVLAAAYAIRYRETNDPLESAHFASAAAGLSVEAQGTGGIPTRAQIEERRRSAPDRERLSR